MIDFLRYALSIHDGDASAVFMKDWKVIIN